MKALICSGWRGGPRVCLLHVYVHAAGWSWGCGGADGVEHSQLTRHRGLVGLCCARCQDVLANMDVLGRAYGMLERHTEALAVQEDLLERLRRPLSAEVINAKNTKAVQVRPKQKK